MKKVTINYFDAVYWYNREYIIIVENESQIQNFITNRQIEIRNKKDCEIKIKIEEITLPYMISDSYDYE